MGTSQQHCVPSAHSRTLPAGFCTWLQPQTGDYNKARAKNERPQDEDKCRVLQVMFNYNFNLKRLLGRNFREEEEEGGGCTLAFAILAVNVGMLKWNWHLSIFTMGECQFSGLTTWLRLNICLTGRTVPKSREWQ